MGTRWRLVWLACFLGFALLAVACDKGEVVHYSNKTNEPLFVELNGRGFNRLPLGRDHDYLYLAADIGTGDSPLVFQVIDLNGCTVLNLETTVARFRKEHDFTLVINQSGLPPPEQRAPCDPKLADIARRTTD
jgi:hypothetical protein